MSQDDFLVLFKSTARPDYKRLLLTALGAPSGTLFETYYRKEHVAQNLPSCVQFEPGLLIGKRAALIFVNPRSDSRIKFYPIRNFTVKDAIPGDTIQFFLAPQDYFYYSDDELLAFNTRIQEQMDLLPPKEHSWAQTSIPGCITDLGVGQGQEAWKKLVERLDREEIGNDHFKDSVFFYLDNIREGSELIPYDSRNGYAVTSGKKYAINGLYYKPRTTKESFQIKFEGSEDISYVSSQLISILPGRTQPFVFSFTCKPANKERPIELRIDSPGKDDGNAPRHRFPATIQKQPLLSNVELWALVLVALGLIGTSLAQTLIPDTSTPLKPLLSITASLLTIIGIAFVKK